MQQQRILTSLFFAVLLLGLLAGCKKDDSNPLTPETVNEAEVLVKYLEANGDYINTTGTSIVSASSVYTNLTSGTQYIIDIRDTAAFNAGHISGAVNVTFANLLTAVQAVPSSYTSIVITCYSGQTAAYGTSLLRLLGYSKVSSLKWGMSSWDSTLAKNYWTAKIGNSYASQMVTTASVKNAKGSLPTLNTGKTTGQEILAARSAELFTVGFSPATITNATVFANTAGYYIVNYWSVTDYNTGHIPGAVQYAKPDLRDTSYLRTLPLDKPVVAYCYTGQTSAFLTAYLRLLGYDARSLLYGTNAMIYSTMPGTKFSSAEIMNYPLIK